MFGNFHQCCWYKHFKIREIDMEKNQAAKTSLKINKI